MAISNRARNAKNLGNAQLSGIIQTTLAHSTPRRPKNANAFFTAFTAAPVGGPPTAASDTADGVIGEIVYSHQSLLPDARCGFDETGTAKAARFRTDLRRYRTNKDHTIVELGEGLFNVFQGCYNP